MKHYAIVLASGTGSRSGLDIPKQFYKIKSGKTVLEYSLDAFEIHKKIDSIILVVNPDFIDLAKKITSDKYKKIIKILPGGAERRESSYIGIFAIKEENAKVLIHDAVRPFVSNEIIDNCIAALKSHNAVNTAIRSSDTIIEVNNQNIIKNVPDRKFMMRSQTPQCFDLNLIKKAHLLAKNDLNYAATDDCGLILRYNLSEVYVIDGNEQNIKITYPIDILLAEKILESKQKNIL